MDRAACQFVQLPRSRTPGPATMAPKAIKVCSPSFENHSVLDQTVYTNFLDTPGVDEVLHVLEFAGNPNNCRAEYLIILKR